jgi:transposase
MNRKQRPSNISLAEWEATPVAVQQLVISLLHTVEQLQQQMAELEEKVNRNSQNSSQPPSSDLPYKKSPPKKKNSGRKRGGQKGHAGKGRMLKPVEEVNQIVISKPMACDNCGGLLLGEDHHPQRHQVSELPEIQPEIIEYQLHSLTCHACGKKNQGLWPSDMPSGSFGPRTQATIGYLSGRMGISRRDSQELLGTLFHLDISLGSISAQEKRVSQALEKAVAEADGHVRSQPIANVDETSWYEMGTRCWMWVMTTPLVTHFKIMRSRSQASSKQLLGKAFAGVVGSDRYSAYNWLDPEKRQLCWSHLKRDFQAFVDRKGESAIIGKLLLAQVNRFFNWWHQVRDGTFTRPEFQKMMQNVRHEVHSLLQIGLLIEASKTRNTCRNLIKMEMALWTFVDYEGVEPTNNAAERALRRSVIWRRRSFGSQSESGSRFVERIQTAVITLRQQKRDVLGFLSESCHAAVSGLTPPSLLPVIQAQMIGTA